MKNSNSMQLLVKTSGIFIALNSLLVIVAWCTGHTELMQYNNNFPPMQLNTAICFLLCSYGLFNFSNPDKGLTKIFALIIIFIALTAGIEFLINYNSGVECWIFSFFNKTRCIHPRTISPVSTLDFLFAGIAFYLLSCKKCKFSPRYVIAITFFSSMIVSFALVALLETITGIGTENLGESITLMSVHSAVCFIVLGVALVLEAFCVTENVTSLFPITILFALLTAVFYVSYCIKNFEDVRFKETIHIQLVHATQDFTLYQATLYRALDRMKERWASQGGTRKNWFEADATNYLEDFPTLLGLTYVDANFHITWVVPTKFKKFIGMQYNLEPERARAIAKAIATQQAQTSSPVKLFSTNLPGFVYLNPLYVNDKFDGLLVASFNANIAFNYLLKSLLTQYDLVVTEENTVLFSSLPNYKEISKNIWSRNTSFVVNNKVWNFCIAPKPALIASKNSFIPLTVLLAGIFIDHRTSDIFWFKDPANPS
jgi:hypothetical protein